MCAHKTHAHGIPRLGEQCHREAVVALAARLHLAAVCVDCDAHGLALALAASQKSSRQSRSEHVAMDVRLTDCRAAPRRTRTEKRERSRLDEREARVARRMFVWSGESAPGFHRSTHRRHCHTASLERTRLLLLLRSRAHQDVLHSNSSNSFTIKSACCSSLATTTDEMTGRECTTDLGTKIP